MQKQLENGMTQCINLLKPKQLDLVIALTWTPRPRNLTPIEQFNCYLPTLRMLKQCSDKYAIFVELNKSGYVHFHGSVLIRDRIRWYKHVLPAFRNWGFVLIKTDPDQGWTDYCSKEADMMSELLELELPITPGHTLLTAMKKTKVVIERPKSLDITKFCSSDDDSF